MAVGFMLISTLGFSAMNVGVRYISTELNATLIVTLRNFLTLMLLLPFVLRNKARLLKTQRISGHFWRGSLGSIGMITWTYCLSIMPVGHATALSYTAPLFTTLFAVLILHEKASLHRWLALFTGFAGALVIIRPDAASFDASSLLVMLATSMWGIAAMMVKSLSRTEPALRIVFYMNFFMLLWALPMGLYHWQWPTGQSWAVLLLIAACSIVMHFSMARAYALAPVTALMPFDFMRLIYTAFLAWLVFGETIDPMTWLGALIVVASAISIARRDAKAAPMARVETAVGP